ncbi:hypothetical protein GGF32_008745 [Allomyces javanicus]|nr:hypothetical protein GGF32_008745 [Allomyces javanicus]
MLTKFESKSNRVKGLAFHAKRPWILASLHNGSIQWWDYRMGTLLDRFDEHQGPVRGVAFHPTQPLFVSGGDDYKINVWNYKQRRCLFTLHGHLDYIRTVFFHHEAPWIISASDDYTIRIWNWQSRTCLAVLTGHNHYVMSAQFHPKEDLVVSASLDFTVRVWDISGLRKRHAAGSGTPASLMGASGMPGGMGGMPGGMGGVGGMGGGGGGGLGGPGGAARSLLMDDGRADLFGNSDAIVKYVLEGHDKGVNWAAFHPTLPLIVSAGDDRQIKIWRMSETKAWEMDTFRGHYNNICNAIFHPRAELVLSDAEDKTIRVWDMARRTIAQTFRRENDRFWVLVAHPHINLFAAGHDSGLIVFKLERERPAMALAQSSLVFVQGQHLVQYDLQSKQEKTLVQVKRGQGFQVSPRYLSYNPTEKLALVSVPVEGGLIELYSLDAAQRDPVKLHGHVGAFVGRNRLAVLDKTAVALHLYDSRGTKLKEVKLPAPATEMFAAGIGHVALSTGTSVELWDLQQGALVAELTNVNNVKYLAWSNDMAHVALLSKHVITICTKQLKQLAVIHETIRVKSAVFDGTVLIYTTLNHIKYALPNGDTGILCTLEQPLYLVHVHNDTITALTRDHKVTTLTVDTTEYRFKLALVNRQYAAVLNMIQTSNLIGQSIIAYLQKKGYPDVALHFVQDPPTRFELAIECGQLDVAQQAAETMDNPQAWTRLGTEALRQGHIALAETAMQRVKNLPGLSLLYLATGQTDKLHKMLTIAQHRGDVMGCMQNAVYLGSVEERARVLVDAGQLSLAWLTCYTHGLTELAEQIAARAGLSPEQLEEIKAKVPADAALLVPPRPVAPMVDNWPVLDAAQNGYFSNHAAAATTSATQAQALNSAAVAAAMESVTADVQQLALDDGWGDGAGDATTRAAGNVDEIDEAGWGFDDMDLPSVSTASATASAAQPGALQLDVVPLQGPSKKQAWARGSTAPVDHILAGSFESAFAVMNRTHGVTHFAPLKPAVLSLYSAGAAHVAALELPLADNWENTDPLLSRPVAVLTPASVQSTTAADAAQLTSQGNLAAAVAQWRHVLHQLALVASGDAAVRAQIDQAREYVHGLSMELARRELDSTSPDPARSLALAAYFTHAALQPVHVQLALRSATAQARKAGHFPLMAQFARRLLDANPAPAVAQNARQFIALADANAGTPVDASVAGVAYDPLHVVPVCAKTFTPIYAAEPAKCRFCHATCQPEARGETCPVCTLTNVQ